MARSPVTVLLEGYNALSEVEQKVFLDLVDPQPEPEAPAKQTRKKRAARSPRADSNAIAKAPKAEHISDRCVYQYAEDSPVNHGAVCTEFFENGIHDKTMGYAGYHEFVAPKSKKAAK